MPTTCNSHRTHWSTRWQPRCPMAFPTVSGYLPIRLFRCVPIGFTTAAQRPSQQAADVFPLGFQSAFPMLYPMASSSAQWPSQWLGRAFPMTFPMGAADLPNGLPNGNCPASQWASLPQLPNGLPNGKLAFPLGKKLSG